jgi:hypothetical protein
MMKKAGSERRERESRAIEPLSILHHFASERYNFGTDLRKRAREREREREKRGRRSRADARPQSTNSLDLRPFGSQPTEQACTLWPRSGGYCPLSSPTFTTYSLPSVNKRLAGMAQHWT